MPDQKLTQLASLVALTADDIFYVVDDPAGLAAQRKVAVSVFDARYLQTSNNLSDLTNAAIARASLGLGTLAVINSPLPIVNGGSGQVTQQAAINALTNVAAATNEHVLTKDTGTGNAIYKAVTVLPVVDETAIVYETGVPANTLTFNVTPFTAARVVTWPDAAMTVAGLEVANVFTARQQVLISSISAVPQIGLYVQQFDEGAGNIEGLKFLNIAAASKTYVTGVSGTNSARRQYSNGTTTISILGAISAENNSYTDAASRNVVITLAPTIEALQPSYAGDGGSTTVSNSYGIKVNQHGQSSVVSAASIIISNAYGLYVADQSGATTNNYAIYTNAGLNRFGDQVAIVGSADRDQLSVTGFTTQTLSPAVITGNTATTNAVLNSLRLVQNTTGTGAAGLGVALQFQLESSTTAAQEAARIAALWNVATHATRVADLVAYASYSGGESEIWRGRAGAAPLFGVLGATPVVRQAHITDPAGGLTVDAEARTAINAILVVLENFGFVATS